ncbi:ABC transporter permease [Vibrio sp. Of7-15]|uniref:ABC transporter permease n=1 Tax=Vibrio sp. Of7-15 TaxID=2724879 RepID=UPI001EF36661|nr:ABC transporter permease [Vibrio sp. Of7-15]MCG7497243.1 ABC transporter permease [Vibrio sp. Of7-15]
MNSSLEISAFALVGFYLLLLLPVGLFARWQLGLNRHLVSSVLRMTLQLAVVGFYLQVLFNYQNPILNGSWLFVMVLVASYSICQRAKLPAKKVLLATFSGQLLGVLVVVPLLLIVVVQAQPWWQAQYLIPITGMLLGNCLTVNILALERWYSTLKQQKNEHEFYVSLGAVNPSLPFIKSSVRAALTPQLASMATLGIVSLPGMMTGQILGGTEPLLAVKYQLLIMVAIFIAGSVSVISSLAIIKCMAFDAYGRLII